MSFHFKQFSITHQTEGLKVNTDGCLLGALSEYNSPQNCLDIGTGTGVIALMLAQKYPEAKSIIAVEMNAVAYEQAKENISSSKFSKQINLIHSDILAFSPETKFDLIVCNPPYFSKHLKGSNSDKNMALHSDSLPQENLLEKVASLLTETGIFMVIYPPKEMQSFTSLAALHGLFPHIIYRIENKAGKLHRIITGFKHHQADSVEKSVLLIDDEGKRTAQFREIMKDFYL